MKIKKEYLVLVMIIVAVSAYLMVHKKDKTHYQLPELAPVADQTLTRIQIKGPGQLLELEKKDDGWTISPQGYKVDRQKMDKILETIGKLTVTTLVSESKNYDRYDLNDAAKISVQAWAGDTTEREFDIGKPAATFRHTFVRLQGDDRVYHAQDNFRSRFETQMDDLRDKTVLKFDAGNISKIEFQNGDTLLTLAKVELAPEKAAPETDTTPNTEAESASEPPDAEKSPLVWQKADGTPVDTKKIDGLLATLSDLRCSNYLYDPAKEALASARYTFSLTGPDQAHSLTVYPKPAAAESTYAATSSQSDEPFLMADWEVDALLEKLDAKPEAAEPTPAPAEKPAAD